MRKLRISHVTACAAVIAAGAWQARADDGLDRVVGRALFARAWVSAPSSTRANDGLGPLFNARSCATCHPGGARADAGIDAAGRPLGDGLVARLAGPHGAPDAVYGAQLQTFGIGGKPEGAFVIEEIAGPAVAGEATLRRRGAHLDDLAYGPLAAATKISLRTAPDLHGRAAFERVDDASLLTLEDPEDRDGDGVRGRARRIEAGDGTIRIGRYGWKAQTPDLCRQIALAFRLDLGMSTQEFPEPWGDCSMAQQDCRAAPHGADTEGEPEIAPAIVERLATFLRSLEPENPAGDDAHATGAAMFAAVGCAACHRPALPARGGGEVRAFTDLLLHDMGQGLADAADEMGARGAEWRTAPLIGLRAALARRTGLLHDGRARDVGEAIGWHAGEAHAAAARFRTLPAPARAALVAFVSSL